MSANLLIRSILYAGALWDLTVQFVTDWTHHVRRTLAEGRRDRRWEAAAAMDEDDDGNALLPNYEMYKAEGDLHLKKGLLIKAVDNYTKVCASC